MDKLKISVSRRRLANFCRKNHILRLSLFGSVLREDFNEGSDIDVLVEFEPGYIPGLRFIRIQDELSSIFGGRQIDLVTTKFLNPHIRNRVISEAVVQYAQG
jgi:predicted nucleotidyltransferase